MEESQQPLEWPYTEDLMWLREWLKTEPTGELADEARRIVTTRVRLDEIQYVTESVKRHVWATSHDLWTRIMISTKEAT
jgi:hypothetical protein